MSVTSDNVLRPVRSVWEQPVGTGIAGIIFDLIQSLPVPAHPSSVLIFGEDDGRPVRRLRVEAKGVSQVPAIADVLATGLDRRRIVFEAEHDPQVPANEVWVTFAHDGSAVLNIP